MSDAIDPIDLHSTLWETLRHAYGAAVDIPDRLILVSTDPSDRAYSALFAALCHQGTTYSASYAALPHLVRIVAQKNDVGWNPLALIAAIEISRLRGNGPEIPSELKAPYHSALERLPEAVSHLIRPDVDKPVLKCLLAALAAAAGNAKLAETIFDLPERALGDGPYRKRKRKPRAVPREAIPLWLLERDGGYE